MNPIVMAFKKLRKRVAVAGDGRGDETGIWIAADIRPLLGATPVTFAALS
jgi:hypothetical protein